jgi:hypothetical protein
MIPHIFFRDGYWRVLNRRMTRKENTGIYRALKIEACNAVNRMNNEPFARMLREAHWARKDAEYRAKCEAKRIVEIESFNQMELANGSH